MQGLSIVRGLIFPKTFLLKLFDFRIILVLNDNTVVVPVAFNRKANHKIKDVV